MAATVPSRTPSSQFNTLAPKPAKASIAINRQSESAPIQADDVPVAMVFHALAAIGMSDKEAAYTMAMDPAQLSRIKTGQARMPFDAIWRLPDLFWSEFADRIGEAKGLSERHLLKVRAARIAELVKLLLEGVA